MCVCVRSEAISTYFYNITQIIIPDIYTVHIVFFTFMFISFIYVPLISKLHTV